jgi:hypothetical protein
MTYIISGIETPGGASDALDNRPTRRVLSGTE